MKLSKKTFLYSISISSLLVGMIVIYFVTMLPSLYVHYMKNQYLQSVVEVEKGYIKKRSYEGLTVQNPTGSATLEIPFEGNELFVAGKAFRLTVIIKEEDILMVLDQIRSRFRNTDDIEWEALEEMEEIDWELLWDALTKNTILKENAPFDLKIHFEENYEEMNHSANGKIHLMEQDIVVFEANAADGDNQYTTYIAMGQTEDACIFSFLPVMTPQIKEIKPIVMGSVPMIAAVLFLVVLVCSHYFSRKIVNPIIRLANYSESVKYAENLEIPPLQIKEKDEIGELGRTLNELYERLRKNYAELEEKNIELKKENKRQEVFLRASSHQLKTPVTASLLLVDGLMQEVGKYKDTKKYLPQVKEQLLSMRKIIEEILYLNHCAENIQREPIHVFSLMEEIVQAYHIQMEENGLSCSVKGNPLTLTGDRELLKKLLDNLVSNAVSYTRNGGKIEIKLYQNTIIVQNGEAHIDEELLPHIYEPFVSGNNKQRGKGLGLYIAAYYCETLGYQLTLENTSDGVLAVLTIPKSYIASSYDLHTEELK